MEYVNKVEITGVVELAALNQCGDTAIAKLSVMTTTEEGGETETTWFLVTATGETAAKVRKGDAVHVKGRLRMLQCAGHATLEVIANSIEIVG